MGSPVGPNLRIIRKLHGKTLEAVAAATRVPRTTLFRIEKGEVEVPSEVRAEFCRVFFLESDVLDRKIEARFVDVQDIE